MCVRCACEVSVRECACVFSRGPSGKHSAEILNIQSQVRRNPLHALQWSEAAGSLAVFCFILKIHEAFARSPCT